MFIACFAAALSAVMSAGPGNDTSPAWSPDGKTIAYVSDADGGSRLKLIDVATRKVRTVDVGTGDMFQPAWTPDGGIVFSRYRPNGTAFHISTFRFCASFNPLKYSKAWLTPCSS